jgi:hypothetical protein
MSTKVQKAAKAAIAALPPGTFRSCDPEEVRQMNEDLEKAGAACQEWLDSVKPKRKAASPVSSSREAAPALAMCAAGHTRGK